MSQHDKYVVLVRSRSLMCDCISGHHHDVFPAGTVCTVILYAPYHTPDEYDVKIGTCCFRGCSKDNFIGINGGPLP